MRCEGIRERDHEGVFDSGASISPFLPLSASCSHPLICETHCHCFFFFSSSHMVIIHWSKCQWVQTTTVSQGGELLTRPGVKGQRFIGQLSGDASLITEWNQACTHLDFCVGLCGPAILSHNDLKKWVECCCGLSVST